MSALLLGVLGARAGTLEVRWEEVPAREGDRGLLADGSTVRIVHASGDTRLRVRCPDGATPERRAVLVTGDDDPDVALLSPGAERPLAAPEGWWQLRLSDLPLGDWAISPMDCTVQRLQARPTSRGLARAEHMARSRLDLRQALPFPEDETAWLDASADPGTWWSRYLALRPTGPHPRGYGLPRDREGWTVQGPQRLRVDAQALDPQDELCLLVDGTPWCQPVEPAIATQVRDGALVREPLRLDGRLAARPVAWELLLPRGRHHLALSGPALAQATMGQPDAFLPDRERRYRLAVFPPSAAEPATAPTRWNVPAASPTVRTTVLATPSRQLVPPAADEVYWLDVSALDPEVAATLRWTGDEDSPGHASFWLEGEGTCQLDFADGGTWLARLDSLVHSFSWTGPAEPGRALPTATGCTARVRATGLTRPVPGAWVASPYQLPDPGEPLRYPVHADAETWLVVSRPAGTAAPFTVTVQRSDGGTDTIRVSPSPLLGAAARAPDGSGWTPALRVPLGNELDEVVVRVSAPAAVRVVQTRPAGEAPPPAGPTLDLEAFRSPDERPVAARLRELSAALATSQDTVERARLLLRRGTLLADHEQPRLAFDDFERAGALAPGLFEANPAAARVRGQLARLLAGPDRWVPDGEAWAPTADLARAAADGDFAAVARALDAQGEDSRLWWRRAVVAGQVLDETERRQVYEALVAFTPDEERELAPLWPLRATTRWTELNQVRGQVDPAREIWPAGFSDPVDELEDALFPDAWPDERRLRLRPGWDLELPPSTASRTLALRCRPEGTLRGPPACTFSVVDNEGRAQAQALAPVHGTSVTLTLPPSATSTYLRVRPEGGVVAEVLLPDAPSARTDHRLRRSWKVDGGERVDFDLLGPTVLRLDTWSPEAAISLLHLTVRPATGPARTATLTVANVAETLLPVPDQGPVTVSLVPSHPLRLVPLGRVPDDALPEAESDLRRIATALAEARARAPSSDGVDPITGVPVDRGNSGRPVQVPRFTVFGSAGVGTTDDPDVETQAELRPLTWRLVQEAGIAQRTRWPLWWEAALSAQEAPTFGALAEGRAGMDWLAVRQRWQLWMLGDAGIVGGSLPSTGPLLTRWAEVQLSAERFLGPRWQVVGRLAVLERAILAGTAPDRAELDGAGRLWSRYRWDHPHQLLPSSELRWIPSPWVMIAWWGELASNSPGDPQPLDHATLGTRFDLARPGLLVQVGAVADRRLADLHRAEPWWGPEAFGRGIVTLWPLAGLGTELSLSARYEARFSRLSGLLELTVYGSRDRALDDLRPSRHPFRYAAEWRQDAAADRRYGVEGTPP